jgi:hypothetical protein
MTKAKWIGAIGAALTTFVAPAAFAGEMNEGQGGYGSAAALLGFGTAQYSVFGLGARGGYTFAKTPIYVGGTFLYHFGSNNVSSLVFGVEAGYDFLLGPVILRPYLGLGDFIGYVDLPAGLSGLGLPDSFSSFALWPGATVMYPINNFFVGGDMRLQIATDAEDTAASFGVFATGGLTF